MKITLDLDDDTMSPILEKHLLTGVKVQTYISAAVRYFNRVLIEAANGNRIGVSNSDYAKKNFTTYNTEISPTAYLEDEISAKE